MPRSLAALPVVVFALLAALLAGSWWFLQERERSSLQSRLEDTSRLAAGRLESFLARHVERIQALGAEMLLEGEIDEPSFRRWSSEYQRANPGLQALNWVSADGVIRWVEPLEPNRQAAGYDLAEHPIAGDAFRAARDRHELTTTPPLELLQGGWGFAAYYPMRRDGETLGFLNAVFRLKDMLRSCLGTDANGDFAYLLQDGDELLGALGPERERVEDLPLARSNVAISRRELTLTVVAPPRWIAAEATWVDEALLVLGLGLAAVLAWLVRVSARRRDEAELAAARFRVLLENAPDAIVAIDAETGALIEGNERAHHLLERGAEQLRGLRIPEVSPPWQPDGGSSKEAFAARLAEARAGGDPVFDWLLRGGDGRDRPVEMRLVRLPDEGREIVRASLLDVSERHRIERELRRTQSHEAMGRMAGSVAHDFNNMLTAILGSAELLESRVEEGSEEAALIGGILLTCERAGNLTQQLLAFSRHAALNPRPLDLNVVVRELLPMLERLGDSDVRVETVLEARAPILADRSQLELALLNLVVNARDAMPGGGCITISTGADEQGAVTLAVADDGEGIPDAIRARVFEPFFTTKGPGVGTGIGLATVQRVVEDARGRVTVESTPGAGTRFTATFPACAERRRPEPAAALPASEPSGDGAAVLLVEDEPGVRDVMQGSLERAGYEVRVAASAEEALEPSRREAGAAPRLLVTDVVLPGMGGVELARRLRREQPGLAVLLISGYATEGLTLADLGEGPLELLPKPFSPAELIEQVREMLALRTS